MRYSKSQLLTIKRQQGYIVSELVDDLLEALKTIETLEREVAALEKENR